MEKLRRELPEVFEAFGKLRKAVFSEGKLSVKQKELIAIGISVAIRCSHCLRHHVEEALKAGATKEEIMEAVAVGLIMRGGPAISMVEEAIDVLSDSQASFDVKPIGVIRSPYKEKSEAPHQGRFSEEIFEIEIFPEFEDGLKDIETCSHLIVLYWLDRAERDKLIAVPPHDKREHGVFATRSPNRPNPIGFAVVELVERKGRILRVKGLDALDRTPVLDIKPYSSELDCVENAKIGWFEEVKKE